MDTLPSSFFRSKSLLAGKGEGRLFQKRRDLQRSVSEVGLTEGDKGIPGQPSRI